MDQLGPHQARTHCGPSFQVSANRIPWDTRRGDLSCVNVGSVCQVIRVRKILDIWPFL